jgi:hypothetical protein
VAFGALVALLAVKAIVTATLFDQPDELTWPASANVYIAHRVQRGGPLYADWRERPHVVAWYGPALYLPVAYLGRWIDADAHDLFMIGRWISLASTVGVVVLIVSVLRGGYGVPTLIALMATLLFLTADEVLWRFDISFRADAPACFLTVAGLALLVRSQRPAVVYASAAVFLLAFLYKQSSIAGPAGAVLWLWLSGRRRQACVYAAISAALFLSCLGLLGAVTQGRYFLNTVQGLKGNATLRNVPHLLSVVMETALVPLGVTVGVAVVEWSHRKWDVTVLAFAVSLVLSAFGTYRDGSGWYYYMTPLAIGCIVCGRQLGQWWAHRSAVAVDAAALTFVLALAAVRYAPQALLRLTELPGHLNGFAQRRENHLRRADSFGALVKYLNGLGGPVLSQFNEVALYCPRSIMIDTLTFTSMADAGAFDDRPLVEDIRQGRLAAIVLNPKRAAGYQSTDQFSRRWRRAMTERYRRVQVPGLEWAEIYRPLGQAAPGPTGLIKPQE